jgi:hypothetical protein
MINQALFFLYIIWYNNGIKLSMYIKETMIMMQMKTSQVVLYGTIAAAAMAAAAAGGYQVGMRRTRAIYIKRINALESARMNVANRVHDILHPEAANEVTSEAVLATDEGVNVDVSVLPVDVPTSKPYVITVISDDITNDKYTSPGISLEDANKIINSELTIGDGTQFECPEGGLWVAGYMVMGSDEDMAFHKAAVEAALLAKAPAPKVKTETKAQRIAREKREAKAAKVTAEN